MMKRALLGLLCVLVLLGITALVAIAAAGQVAYHLLLGWFFYLNRVIPKVYVRWDGVAVFVVGLVILTVLIHLIASWLRREMSAQTAKWRLRSTLQVVGLLIMTFVAGIVMIGVTHQTAWLVTDDSPSLVTAFSRTSWGSTSRYNLRYDLWSVVGDDGRFPTRSSMPSEEIEHSWVTRILPYSRFWSKVDQKKPWDHPDNQPEIRKLVPIVLNESLRPAILRDENGYGVSHYAGNTHLFDHVGKLIPDDISDGAANTLMIGEVNANFQAWAKPHVNRDPALGIDRSPDGFGGPVPNEGALFLMADGSVRLFAPDTDPTVLQALGTLKLNAPKQDPAVK